MDWEIVTSGTATEVRHAIQTSAAPNDVQAMIITRLNKLAAGPGNARVVLYANGREDAVYDLTHISLEAHP